MANTKSKHQIEITATDKATPVLSGIQNTLGKLGVFVGGAAVAGAFVKATEAAIQFEQGLAKTATLLPPASRNMEQFARGLERIRLSGAGQSLSDLTEGLYQTVSAGVSAADAVEVLDVAARAAKAGFTDTRTAVDGLTTVLNAYKMSADEATKVADILFVTQNRGKTTFGEMASSLGVLLPIASSAGAKFEDMAAAIASLTMQGIPTAIAITGLRATISAFIEKGDAGKIATLGFAGALKDLSERTGGDQKKMQDYLGRVEALNTVMALTGENAATLDANMLAMANSTGTADDAFRTFNDTVAGARDRFQAFIEIASEQFGTGFVQNLNLPETEKLMRQSEAWVNLGRSVAYLANIITYFPSKAFNAIANVGEFIGHYFGQIRTQSAPGTLGKTPGRIPDVYGPPVSPASTFIGPIQDMQSVAPKITTSGNAVADALTTVARNIERYYSYGNAQDDRMLGSRHPFAGTSRRSAYGTSFMDDRAFGGSFYDTPDGMDAKKRLDEANEALAQFQQRVQTVTSYTLSLTSSFTQAIVRGIEQGTLRIKDLFNALKSAVLQILADLAAKIAAAGILSILFPSTGFKGFLGPLTGGLFGGGSVNSFRPAPVGANPNAGGGAFGGGVHNHYYIQGSLVTREQIANEVIRIGTKAAQRGQNSLQVR